MNVIDALEDVRGDWQYVWDWRYGLHNATGMTKDIDDWWTKMLVPLGKIPHEPLRTQMHKAFADIIQNKPATAEECRRVLQEILQTLATVHRCLHFTLRDNDPTTSKVTTAQMIDMSAERHLGMSLSAFGSSSGCMDSERETFHRDAWNSAHFTSYLVRPNIVGRVAELHDSPIGHYVCERRGDVAALLTFAVRRSARGFGISETLMSDALRFVSSNCPTARHRSLSFELDTAHNCTIPPMETK